VPETFSGRGENQKMALEEYRKRFENLREFVNSEFCAVCVVYSVARNPPIVFKV